MTDIQCTLCGEVFTGTPALSCDHPVHYFDVPESERSSRCSVGTDDCVIDESLFFVRGCLELPVLGGDDDFHFGVWISLSEKSFSEWVATFDKPNRSHIGPFFGWLATELAIYPSTVNLKTMVHLRDEGLRPQVVLDETSHPLAIEQRDGVSIQRLTEIYTRFTHSATDGG